MSGASVLQDKEEPRETLGIRYLSRYSVGKTVEGSVWPSAIPRPPFGIFQSQPVHMLWLCCLLLQRLSEPN
jgi:hypothetical protein